MKEESLRAVVFTERAQVRDAVRTALKETGVSDDHISYPAKSRECIGLIKEKTQSILVLDWEVGAGEVVDVLTTVRETQQQDSISIFLVAATMSEKIIAAGAEYGASQIHTGDITKDKVKIVIAKLMEDVKSLSPIKQLLRSVAEFRTKGDWAQATSVLQQLQTKEPNNTRVQLELAENYIFEKQWDKAQDLLKKSKEGTPPNARALHLLGKCLLKQGKEVEAIALFKEAKMINPFNIDRLMELGGALLKIDKVKEAHENFDEVISISPKHKGAKQGQGTCMLMDGEVNEALSLLKDAITGTELASVFNTAAVLTMRQGRIPQGMDLYESAAHALSKQKEVLARIYYNKGIGFYRWKKLDEAKACFEKAIELDPKFENAQHNIRALSPQGKKPASAGAPASAAPTATSPTPPANPASPLATITFDDGLKDPFSTDLSDEDERL